MSKILDFFKGKPAAVLPIVSSSAVVDVRNSSSSKMELPGTNDYPVAPNWFFSATLGQPRNINFYELRQYARSPWIQITVNAILKQVFTTKWKLVSKVKEDEGLNEELSLEIENFLKTPNPFGGTFKSVFYPYLKDILLLDQAVIYKARVGKELTALMPYDGVKFLVDMDGHGIVRGYYEYSYVFVRAKPKFYPKEDIIMTPFNVSSEFHPYGWSPLQSIVQVVEVMIQSTRFNKDFFINSAIPSAIVDVLTNDKDNYERFKSTWDSEFRGKAHKLMVSNVPTNVKQLNISNRDMEWLEGQKWYNHLIFASYGISPQEAGFYEDSNRSTSESQERVSSRNGIIPHYEYLAEVINKQVIEDKWGEECPLKFEWELSDTAKEQTEHQQIMDKLDRKVYTINEVRALEGLAPLEGGDSIMPEPQPMANGQTNNPNEEQNNSNKPKEEEPQKEEETKKEIEIEEISEDYSDFVNKTFKKWEGQIIKVVENEYNENKIKSLSVLIAQVMNFVSSASFLKGLRKYVIKAIDNGVEEAETTLNFNFVSGEEMKSLVDIEFNKQLNGYNINGFQWAGIKGVTREVQAKILKIIEDGISSRRSVNLVKNDIHDLFLKEYGRTEDGKELEGRSMAIARTETIRLKELGKHTALENSGLEVSKQWVATMDSRTSERCKRLNGSIVKLRDKFRDGEEEYLTPPSHVNCRCRTKAILNE